VLRIKEHIRSSIVRPLAVLNAIIFGSAIAITFGLSGVAVIFLFLQGSHPELADELGPLVRGNAVFAALAITSGLSLFASLKKLQWRWIAQTAMWFTALATGALYWPR
jgi:hypothetical protein